MISLVGWPKPVNSSRSIIFFKIVWVNFDNLTNGSEVRLFLLLILLLLLGETPCTFSQMDVSNREWGSAELHGAVSCSMH